MATYYVSNAAVNGYGAGSSSNSAAQAQSQSTPWDTITTALGNASVVAGDIIVVNPSGTVYVEGASGSYLNVTKGVTIQTDPALVGSQGKFVLRSNAATRVVNISASNVTLNNIILDANSVANSSGVTVQGVTGLSVTSCDIKNMVTASTNAISMFVANASVTLDKCTCTQANGNSTVNFVTMGAAGLSVTIKGCTVDHCNAFVIPNGNNNQTLIRTSASGDGTRNTVSNCTYGVRMPGATVTTLDIEAVDFSTLTQPSIWDNNLTTCTVSSCTVTNCTCAGAAQFVATNGTWSGSIYGNTTTTTSRFFQSSGVGLNNMLIHDNTITQTGATGEPVQITAGGSGIKVYNNTISTDITSHVIEIGNDGQSTPVKNNETITTSIPLGDSSGDTYYYQPFTTNASTVTPNGQIPSSVQFSMKKTGSPTGSITAYLYNDSSGKPGTLVATSEFTMSASNLTTSSQFVEFWFPSHPVLSYATQYHAVLKYTGTNDGTNYVSLDAGTTYGSKGGYSTDGSTWGAAGTKAAIFNVCYLAFEITDAEIHDNKITCNVSSSTIVHACFFGGVTGGKIYRNRIYTRALCLIFKLCDGSNGSHPLLCYDNMAYATCGVSSTMYDKGSRNAQFYQNTIINASQASAPAMCLGADFTTGNYNAQASQNAVVKNNIIYRSATTAGVIYLIGITSEAQPTCVNPTIDYNCVYAGNNTTMATDNRSGSASGVSTFANWQALGFDAHGKGTDPLLTSYTPATATDFTPTRLSPAFGMGTDLSATVPTDYAGTSFGSFPCVGAYVFTGPAKAAPGRLSGGMGGNLSGGL